MYIPISESWLSARFLLDLTTFTSFEKITLIILINILFFISFKFFYNLFKDVIRGITRIIKGCLK